MSGLQLLVHVLAVHRLVQLAIGDRITAPIRWRLIRWAYRRAGDDDFSGVADWDELTLADDQAPMLAYLATCWWCTGLWCAGATPGGDRKEKRWNTPDPSAAEALASTAPASGSALNAQHVSWNHERRTGGSDSNTPLGMTRIASRPPLRTCSAPPTSTRDPGGDRSTDLVVDQPDGDRALRGGDLKRTDRRCNRDA